MEAQLHTLSERQRRGAQRALAVGAVPAALTARVKVLRTASDAANGAATPGPAGDDAPAGMASPPPAVPAASAAGGVGDAGAPGWAADSVDAVLGRAVAMGLLTEAEVDRITDDIATGARTEGEVEAEWKSKLNAATANAAC